jgi:hypothetical protein
MEGGSMKEIKGRDDAAFRAAGIRGDALMILREWIGDYDATIDWYTATPWETNLTPEEFEALRWQTAAAKAVKEYLEETDSAAVILSMEDELRALGDLDREPSDNVSDIVMKIGELHGINAGCLEGVEG